jgi:ATP-binding cassette subfamily B protein
MDMPSHHAGHDGQAREGPSAGGKSGARPAAVGESGGGKPARRGFWRSFRLILRRGRQVWRLVPLRHKVALGAAAIIMAVASAANTVIPLLLGTLVDQLQRLQRDRQAGGAPDVLFRTALFYLVLIGAVYFLRELFNVARRYMVENTCTRIDRDMTVRVVAHLLKVDLGTLTHEKVGALHGRISRSVDGFVRFLRLFFLDFFPAVLTGAFALIATLTKQPWLGLIMVGVIPASISLTLWQLTSQKGVRLRLLRSREEMDGTVVEQLSGLDYVRAANTQRQEIKRVAHTAERRRVRELRHHFQMSLFGSGKALNEGLFHVLVLGLAIYLALHGRIEYGEILTFSMLFLNVMSPLSEVHRVIDDGHESSLRVGDLIDILSSPIDDSFDVVKSSREPNLPSGRPEPAGPARRDDQGRPEPLSSGRAGPAGSPPPDGPARRDEAAGPIILVENLQLEYLTADGQRKRALDGLNLDIRRGERIGIAGRSGGGKSTWLKVLLRLAHPCGGRVFFGGVPLEEVSREAIGRLVGYVGQSPFVFSGTIEENIAYGVEGATPEAIRRAAEMACIHGEVLAMPGGYRAPVAERGQNLSGGQRQRLALARLFLKNPPILILDEATSALDNISERSVQRALAAARADRTVIVVAHRLSTLLDADRILVFDQGRIVESGTYEELVRMGGVFAELLLCAQEGPNPAGEPELEKKAG